MTSSSSNFCSLMRLQNWKPIKQKPSNNHCNSATIETERNQWFRTVKRTESIKKKYKNTMLYICLKINFQHSWLMTYSQCNETSVTLNNYSNQNTALCKNVIFILYLACTSASSKETIWLWLILVKSGTEAMPRKFYWGTEIHHNASTKKYGR